VSFLPREASRQLRILAEKAQALPVQTLGTALAEGRARISNWRHLMIRFTTLSTCIALSLVAAVGCDKAVDEQRKADEARADADKKITNANNDANDKINAAQADADKKVADAQANFSKLREDFRHVVTQDLVKVDKDIADLDAKTTTAKGKAKTDLDAALPNIRTLRESVATEYRSLEMASALTWDASKARVEKALDDLKKAIDKAD
jgi:hypothetical protein